MFSARGKCEDCGLGHMTANVTQLVTRKGPYFEHWYQACRSAFEFDRNR